MAVTHYVGLHHAVAEQQQHKSDKLQSEAAVLEGKLAAAQTEQKGVTKSLKSHQKHLDKCTR